MAKPITTIPGHTDITIMHVQQGVVIRQPCDDDSGSDNIVFIPYCRIAAVVEAMGPVDTKES